MKVSVCCKRLAIKMLTCDSWHNPDGKANQHLRNDGIVWNRNFPRQCEQGDDGYCENADVGRLNSELAKPSIDGAKGAVVKVMVRGDCDQTGDGVVECVEEVCITTLLALDRNAVRCERRHTRNSQVDDEGMAEMMLLRQEGVADENEPRSQGRQNTSYQSRYGNRIIYSHVDRRRTVNGVSTGRWGGSGAAAYIHSRARETFCDRRQ